MSASFQRLSWAASIRGYAVRLRASKLGFRLMQGAFWNIVGVLISRGSQFLAMIVVARILGKVGFGELAVVQSTLMMFGSAAGFGLGVTVTKLLAEYRNTDLERAGRVIALSERIGLITAGLMGFALFGLAPWLAEYTLAAPQLHHALEVGALVMFFSAVNGVQTGALAGFESYKAIAAISIFAGIAVFPLVVGGAYLAGVQGALWGLALSMATNWLLNHVALRKKMREMGVVLTTKRCWHEKHMLWRYCLPTVAAGLIATPVMWACNAILVHQPNGLAELGVYNAVTQIKQIPEMMVGMLLAPLLPVLSERFGANAILDYRRTLSFAFSLSLMVVVPVSLIQTAVPSLTLIPFGSDYQGNYATVQWLMVHAGVVGLFSPVSTLLVATGRMWVGFVINAIWASLYLALAYYFVPRYAAVGLAAASTLASLGSTLFFLGYSNLKNRSLLSGIGVTYEALLVILLFILCIISSHILSSGLSAAIGLISACVVLARAFLKMAAIWKMGQEV